MRRMMIGILLCSLLIGICGYAYATDIAPNFRADSMEAYDNMFNTVSPQTLRCGFVSAYELSPILGRFDHFVSYTGDLSRYLYTFILPQATGGYYGRIDVTVEHRWDGYCDDYYKDWLVLDMSCVNGSMDKLMPEYQEQIDDSADKFIIRRDVFMYIYIHGELCYIKWENNGIIITLGGSSLENPGVYSTEYYTGTIIEKLLSINEEEFQEAKTQLLSIEGTYKHTFESKWYREREGHWQKCQCGEKGEVYAHTDEDGNNRCDACFYDLPKVTAPAAKPTKPTTVPATEPTPAAQEPAPPATGMWIGIGAACAVVAAAVVVILLRKKKSA